MKMPRFYSAKTLLLAGAVLVLAASLAWCFLGGSSSSGDDKLAADAAKLESQGDAAGAEAAYKKILADNPANLAARSALARLADHRAAAQEAALEQESASLPPEPPEAVAEKMAAAQAQMDALLGQFTARSATPAAAVAQEKAPEPKSEPAPPATASAPSPAPPPLPVPVPVMKPAIPPPGVPLALATTAPAPVADSRALYEYIDGVNPGTGTFTLTGGGRWIERCPDANIFEFEEKARQTEFIELFDASRQVGIRLGAKGTSVRLPGSANGAWQELYPGGWRDKTRPGASKVIVRMIPEDIGLEKIKSPGMDVKPALDRNAEDLKLLSGTWECVSAHQNGVPVRDYDGVRAVIQGTRLTWIYPRKGGGQDLDEASFTVDATKTPRRFDWHSHARSPEQKHLRIFSLDTDTLIIGSRTSTGGVHPASFEQCVWVFRYRRVASEGRR